MEISARNQLTGRITDIKRGAVMAQVTLDLGNGQSIVSAITVDSVDGLRLQVGDQVTAIVKASSVMIGK